MDTRELREQWESLNGAIIDDAYDGTGVLNRPNRGSVVIMSKEDCDEIVADHNQVLDALRAENERLRDALRSYAECSDGCTCGDGWSHDEAVAALKDKFGRCGDCKLKDYHAEGCSYFERESTQPAPDQKGKL
jgi:hypothetical protein